MATELDEPQLPPNPRRRIAILGGGMAGVTAAWRLSEGPWRDRFESITIYQRGARLGGKGASSRGQHGRIEEHGLHVWLGHYDNAFRLIRDCYDELDRPTTDPSAPIRTWDQAFLPSSLVGMEDEHAGSWDHWIGDFARNDLVPGDPLGSVHTLGPSELLERTGRLLQDFAESFDREPAAVSLSFRATPGSGRRPSAAAMAVMAAGALVEGISIAVEPASDRIRAEALSALDLALDELRDALAALSHGDPGTRRTWHLVSMVSAVARGLLADGVLQDPRGFSALNDEDFRDWIRRHGAPEEAVTSTFVRGLYDLVFAHVDGDPEDQRFAAGVGAFLSTKTLLDYKGSIFWKMAAGMGDVVFAPLYQALRARGVDVVFFHRVDHLHLSEDRSMIDAISIGRQVALAPDLERYEPLVRVAGLPCFPEHPLLDQLEGGPELLDQPFEAIWCEWADAEQLTLHRGVDFDDVVLAVPPAMAAVVADELIDSRIEWRRMVDGIASSATQALQLWLREDDRALGWPAPGTTVTGFVDGFDTWASMPHLIDMERWPPDDRPRTIAYFCNTLAAPVPANGDWQQLAQDAHEGVRRTSLRYLDRDLPQLLPGVRGADGFRWDLLCGAPDGAGPEALDTQFWTANVDPSDRYVQSAPGSDRLRLRSDESGFDNLVLAGDWTDNGCNAGCIEAAVLSGLQAANALLGRHRWHRILGAWMP